MATLGLKEMGKFLWKGRETERPGNKEKDRIGFLRLSLSQRERQKIRKRVEYYNSDRDKAQIKIKKERRGIHH